MTLVLARQIFILGSKTFEHLDFLLLLGRPQKFTTLALIVYEANEAKIVRELIRGTKGIIWYHSKVKPFQAGTPNVQ